MSNLKPAEVKLLDHFFNDAGNVLDFSIDSFDEFSTRSVGIPICEKYNLSKGKSLRKFLYEENDDLVIRLLADLFDYYKNLMFISDQHKKDEELYKKCESILTSFQNKLIQAPSSDRLENHFNTEYMRLQIKTMQESIHSFPAEAIGKAKELVESCFITILNSEGIEINKKWDLPKLSKETCGFLKLTPDDIPEEKRASETIKQILGNLSAITTGIAELRNPHGTGHGKNIYYKGLSSRHAQLAVGAASTLVQFVWETYQERKENSSPK